MGAATDGAAPRSELADELLRRERSPRPVGEVFSSVIGSLDASDAARSTWSAGRAWYSVNGDIERSHTTGVYVRAPKGHETLPTLIVYVDSRARAVDFTANREIYLARLEHAGQRFAEVVFRESKRPRADASPRPRTAPPSPETREPLDDAALRTIDDLCSQIPEPLRKSVSRAMRESWQR